MKILYGKRTTLFPFDESDVPYFHSLLKHEGYLMGQKYFNSFEAFFAFAVKNILERRWMVFTLMTKPGAGFAKPEKFGFVIIDMTDPAAVQVHGLTDKKIMKGILKILRRPEKLTYAEDALRTALSYCFDDLKLIRVFAEVYESNMPCKKLLEKCGFLKSVIVYELEKKEIPHVIREEEVVANGRAGESRVLAEVV